MNEDELYRLAEAAFKAQVREGRIPAGPQRDSLWNAILDQLEAMPPEKVSQIHREVFGTRPDSAAAPAESTAATGAPAPEQPGMMRRLGDFFNDRTQKAATMDAEEGTTGFDRLATGAVYGAINAPHMIAKGVTGIGRMLGFEEPYNRYRAWSQGFQDDYDAVTPYLGKTGMAGEMLGSLPTDLPLYASGMGAASKVPAVGRMLGSTSRAARFGGEILGNAGVDFAQGAVIGAGDENAGVGDMFANGAVGMGMGGVANVGMAGVGAAGRAARRGMRAAPAPDVPLKPDYIDNVIANELPAQHGPRPYVWQNPNSSIGTSQPAPPMRSPFATPTRGPQQVSAMDLISTMMGKQPNPIPADELDVVQLANKVYAHKVRNRRQPPSPFSR